jgi:hypothetical protein
MDIGRDDRNTQGPIESRNLIGCLRIRSGQACFAILVVLLDLGPEPFVSGSHVAGNIGRHLGRQTILGSNLVVGFLTQADLVTHLAMFETVAAHIVQRITVGQLGLPQLGELLRVCLQFEFGGDELLHRRNVLYFRSFVNDENM